MVGNGCGPGGAEQIVSGVEARRPIAQRLVDRVLESPAAAFDRHHGRAHQLHPEDVELLPRDVLGAHVDDGFEPEQRADDRGRDAVLAGARLGDQPGLAHALRKQPLPEHLVGLVRAAVEEVLALEIEIPRQVAAPGERGRPAGVIGEKAVQLGGEVRVVLRVEERRLELLECRHEDLGHIAAPEAAEAAVQAHAASCPREVGRRASNKAAILSGDLRPGRSSTPEPTSIA